MLQHGKVLHNRYDSNYSQLRRPEFIEPKSKFTKNNEDLTNKSDVQLNKFRLEQLNSRELKLIQDNQAFKNYMIKLCENYIHNIGLREYDLNEFNELYNILTNSKLKGGDKNRNWTYKCIKNIPVEIELKWSLDSNNYIVLEYTNRTTGENTKNIKCIIGDNKFDNVISEIMEYLNSVLLTLHTQELSNYKTYIPFHFNYQVISLLNYYINKDLNYFRQTKLVLALSTIYYHINSFSNNEVYNVIINALPFTCVQTKFEGDCALNTYLASIDPKIRQSIVEYIIKNCDNTNVQQTDNLITKIQTELNNLFDVVTSTTFNGFVTKFKSNLYLMLFNFRTNLHVSNKYKVKELSRLYISILIVKAKIIHLVNIIIRAPNLNFNVLAEAFEYACLNRNCINNLIVEKYSDSNKHYLTLPVGLCDIPHAVLLVIERNDVKTLNSKDKGYVIDLNNLKILFNNPAHEFVASQSIKYEYLLPNPTQAMIDLKNGVPMKVNKIGIRVNNITITDKPNLSNHESISKYYEKYLHQYSSYLYLGVSNECYVRIPKLFSCPIDDTFNVTNKIYDDLFNMTPTIFQLNGLTKDYLIQWNVNTMSMFSMCINKVIEYSYQNNISIPWEYIITGVNNLNYPYLFYIVGYLLVLSSYDNYSNHFTTHINGYTTKLKELYNDLFYITNGLTRDIKSTATTIKDYIKNNKDNINPLLDILLSELDKICDRILSNYDKASLSSYFKVFSLVSDKLNYIRPIYDINTKQSTQLRQIIKTININPNCVLDLSNSCDILNYVYNLNCSVGLSFKPTLLTPENSTTSYKLFDRFKGGNNNISSIQQLLVFLLVLVIIVIVVVLIVRSVGLIRNNNNN